MTGTASSRQNEAHDLAKVEAILERYPHKESSLVEVLHDVYRAYGYLPCHALEKVASTLGLPVAKVFSVATFYKAFSVEPKGQVVFRVCIGTACHIRGAETLAEELGRQLGVEPGKTTADGRFTLETVNCVGTCAMAPVVVAGSHYHGGVVPEDIPAIIEAHEHDR